MWEAEDTQGIMDTQDNLTLHIEEEDIKKATKRIKVGKST